MTVEQSVTVPELLAVCDVCFWNGKNVVLKRPGGDPCHECGSWAARHIRLSQPQDAPPVRDAELVALVAEARRMGRLQPLYVGTWRKVNEVFDVLLDALSARDRLLAEAKEALRVFDEYVNAIGQADKPDNMMMLPYKVQDGEYHDYRALTMQVFRRAASAYRRLEGGVK